MRELDLPDLQASIRDSSAFTKLEDYLLIAQSYLRYVEEASLTRIVSPSHHHYIFYQYPESHGHHFTRPLNTDLFFESSAEAASAFERFVEFLPELRRHRESVVEKDAHRKYVEMGEINRVVYTLQQSIGGISDSFDNPNQARKRAGQLFENLISLIIQNLGVDCESRTVSIPIPGFPDYKMSYQLDLVFSLDKAIVASETKLLHESEIVGSVKTTSKDRIDKIFLDKYLLSKFLDRDVTMIAVFLHDVQRAARGNSIFGINSTFKTNHFLGYTVALNKMDGVYYVDPRPEMSKNARLREQISDFQQLLVHDLWRLPK